MELGRKLLSGQAQTCSQVRRQYSWLLLLFVSVQQLLSVEVWLLTCVHALPFSFSLCQLAI
jgi:hypothetical protein